MSAATQAVSDSALEPIAEGLSDADRGLVARTLEFVQPVYAGKTLDTGEPALDHALGTARKLAELRLDGETRAAALLFSAPNYLADSEEALTGRFGKTVAALVAGIARLNSLRVVTRGLDRQGGNRESQAEVLRKMLLAMVEDIRVVLVRLASRTQTLQFMARAPDAVRRPVAQETLDIYAPLANRLGVWQLKWELEDLSFRFLEPETYRAIAVQLDQTREERERFLETAGKQLAAELAAAGVKAEVTGRPKHLYSIYNKMRRKGRSLTELHDVRGLRVLVEEVKDCYTALGVAHNLWQPVPGEFDDYISRPKANFYRSLHTAVIGADGHALEVQIRTYDMHRHAELGVAAHWKYKEGAAVSVVGKEDPFDQKIAWLRQVLAWRDEVVDSSDWVEQFKQAALDDTVYVLTPQGKVLDLPRGSTPVDFAYALHTDLGHRCRGAKVDGAMVPLDTRLANGQRVEIVAAKTGGPSRDWLNPALGYLGSSRARNKVRQWFNSQDHAQTVAQGRAAVERELQREGRTGVNLDELAQHFDLAHAEDLFAAVAREEIGHKQLLSALRGEAREQPQPSPAVHTYKSKADAAASGILIVGVDRLLTQLARCCKPAPPDEIVGFVTRGRGISIHRRVCAGVRRLKTLYPERLIAAEWGSQSQSVFPVDITVRAEERTKLLHDVSEVFSREKINVTAMNSQVRQSVATMSFTLEVANLDQLRRALALVKEVSGVIAAGRR